MPAPETEALHRFLEALRDERGALARDDWEQYARAAKRAEEALTELATATPPADLRQDLLAARDLLDETVAELRGRATQHALQLRMVSQRQLQGVKPRLVQRDC